VTPRPWLVVTARPPLPPHSGGQVRVWNIARALARRRPLDLLSFAHQGEPVPEDALREVFSSVTLVPRAPLASLGRFLGSPADLARAAARNLRVSARWLGSRRPLLSLLYDSGEMRRRLREADRSGSYDLLYAETFSAIASLRDDLGSLRTPLLLIEQNIESASFSRQAAQQRRPLVRRLMEWDVRRVRREEELFWRRVRLLGALSPVDAEVMRTRVGREPLLVSNGVDTAWFAQPVAERRAEEVLFVGSLRHFQNVDALSWLLDEIWPQVAAARPAARLRLVGRGADEALHHTLAARGLALDEGVDDIRAALQQATVLIAPIRAGSGTKYKVIEAMASGLPVVTTPVGAEGLPVAPGREMVVSSEARVLAAEVAALLGDPARRRRQADAARAFVAAYDWTGIVAGFEEQLAQRISSTAT
jgi:polysaccharide biosynthesis protein PslH